MMPIHQPRDPRLYQIATLGGLLLYGYRLELDVDLRTILVIFVTALTSQWFCGRLLGLPRFDARSPLISALSLSLLLRTRSLEIAALAAMLAIGSKFVIRWRGKHVFNPTNFGLAAVLLLTPNAWVSPGQWGSIAYFGLLLAGLGGLVIHRAARSDVTYAFLGAYAALLVARTAWLGDPWQIAAHQLQSGALLIFAFFMISDPKTTPDSRAGRILYACLAAAVALTIQFALYRPNGLLFALVGCAPLVPLIDRLLPGLRYRWMATTQPRHGPSYSHSQNKSLSPGAAHLAPIDKHPARHPRPVHTAMTTAMTTEESIP